MRNSEPVGGSSELSSGFRKSKKVNWNLAQDQISQDKHEPMAYNNVIPSSLRKHQAYINSTTDSMHLRPSMITDETRPSNVTSSINKTLTFAASHGRDNSISSGKNESKYFEEEEYAVYLDRSDA